LVFVPPLISQTSPLAVRFVDFDIEAFALILELMPGGSLLSHIRDNSKEFKWSERYQMFLDICEGMTYLHDVTQPDGSVKPKIYHQDLKSANVLLLRDQHGALRGKISDFGLSALKNEQASNAVSSYVEVNGGTRCYQAPELFNQYASFSSKSDVYAAGIVLLELIALRPPNRLHQVLWPTVLEIKMPAMLCELLKVTLAEDPARRTAFDQLFLMLESEDGKEIGAQVTELDLENFKGMDEKGEMSEEVSSYAQMPTESV
jgi:serine/threonine protein kinase